MILTILILRQSTKYPVKPSEEGLLNLESVTIKVESAETEDRKSMVISWSLQVNLFSRVKKIYCYKKLCIFVFETQDEDLATWIMSSLRQIIV